MYIGDFASILVTSPVLSVVAVGCEEQLGTDHDNFAVVCEDTSIEAVAAVQHWHALSMFSFPGPGV